MEFASAGAERQSHKVNVKHDNIWAVLWPGRVLVSLCWGRAGLSLHHTEVYRPRSITFTAHGDRMEYFQTEYNILPPGAAPPRKADLPHHQNQADGWQTRVVCSRIKLNSSAQHKKKTTQQPRAYGETTSAPRASSEPRFPHQTRVFGGRGEGGNASPSSEPSSGGAEAGMSEFGEGRTSPSRLIPSLEGAERGLVQLLASWSDSPFPPLPIPRLPTPSHPQAGKRKARLPPAPPAPKTWRRGRMGQRRSWRPPVLWGERNE